MFAFFYRLFVFSLSLLDLAEIKHFCANSEGLPKNESCFLGKLSFFFYSS